MYVYLRETDSFVIVCIRLLLYIFISTQWPPQAVTSLINTPMLTLCCEAVIIAGGGGDVT